MLQLEYWISELSNRTGVSVRTIRYYIEEGVLPRPEIRGKYAVFTDAYLHRLELIKLLKDAYMPLKEIKVLLSEMNDDQVARYLSEQRRQLSYTHFSQEVEKQTRTKGPGIRENSAEEYINRILRGTPPQRIKRDYQYDNQPPPAPLFLQPPEPAKRESWQRIELQPGMELHLRQPLNSRQRRLIEKIVELIQSEIKNQRED